METSTAIQLRFKRFELNAAFTCYAEVTMSDRQKRGTHQALGENLRRKFITLFR